MVHVIRSTEQAINSQSGLHLGEPSVNIRVTWTALTDFP
jgi:hypothetical protein